MKKKKQRQTSISKSPKRLGPAPKKQITSASRTSNPEVGDDTRQINPAGTEQGQTTLIKVPIERQETIDRIWKQQADLLGIPGLKNFAQLLLNQLASVGQQWAPKGDLEKYLTISEAVIALKPRNGIEALLISQMMGTHHAAMAALTGLNAPNPMVEIGDLYTARAARLMRVFMQQVEALAKLRGESGQQKALVENVNVQPGGQAFVGTVTAIPAGDGRGPKDVN